jgi:ribose 5-phosphate isomerase B
MFTKFVLSYDHRVDEKYVQVIKKFLGENGYGCLEISLNDDENNDYPILASRAYQTYLKEDCDGMILLCGTGVGMNVVANKFDGIRSVLAQSEADAFFARNDENANCIVFPAGKANEEYSVKICKRKMIRALNVFVETPFEGGRHQRRVDEITEIEKGRKF